MPARDNEFPTELPDYHLDPITHAPHRHALRFETPAGILVLNQYTLMGLPREPFTRAIMNPFTRQPLPQGIPSWSASTSARTMCRRLSLPFVPQHPLELRNTLAIACVADAEKTVPPPVANAPARHIHKMLAPVPKQRAHARPRRHPARLTLSKNDLIGLFGDEAVNSGGPLFAATVRLVAHPALVEGTIAYNALTPPSYLCRVRPHAGAHTIDAGPLAAALEMAGAAPEAEFVTLFRIVTDDPVPIIAVWSLAAHQRRREAFIGEMLDAVAVDLSCGDIWQAHDVSTFVSWMAEGNLDARRIHTLARCLVDRASICIDACARVAPLLAACCIAGAAEFSPPSLLSDTEPRALAWALEMDRCLAEALAVSQPVNTAVSAHERARMISAGAAALGAFAVCPTLFARHLARAGATALDVPGPASTTLAHVVLRAAADVVDIADYATTLSALDDEEYAAEISRAGGMDAIGSRTNAFTMREAVRRGDNTLDMSANLASGVMGACRTLQRVVSSWGWHSTTHSAPGELVPFACIRWSAVLDESQCTYAQLRAAVGLGFETSVRRRAGPPLSAHCTDAWRELAMALVPHSILQRLASLMAHQSTGESTAKRRRLAMSLMEVILAASAAA